MDNDEPGFFSTSRVAIVGLGLMGGSLAMALRGKCAALLGVDHDPRTVALARQRRVVDQASSEPAELLPQADVVILATPVNAIIQSLRALPEQHPGPAIVIDLGSTKAQIVAAMQELPERFDPLGGHPMCGKEVSGLENSDPRLFQGAAFAFIPLERTSPRARSVAEELARLLGAHPLWLDPHTHDRWVAATSHLPYLVSNALAYSTPAEAAPLAGTGFRSATRLAQTSPVMMLDVLMSNREAILAASGRFRAHLDLIDELLRRGDFEILLSFLKRGAERRNGMIQSLEHGETQ
jgi:prephenate dehydrogenase